MLIEKLHKSKAEAVLLMPSSTDFTSFLNSLKTVARSYAVAEAGESLMSFIDSSLKQESHSGYSIVDAAQEATNNWIFEQNCLIKNMIATCYKSSASSLEDFYVPAFKDRNNVDQPNYYYFANLNSGFMNPAVHDIVIGESVGGIYEPIASPDDIPSPQLMSFYINL